MKSGTIRIHIDAHDYETPNPTTGKALYKLGNIKTHKELFREVDGEEDEQPISENDEPLHLQVDDHFYSDRVFSIFVNTEDKKVTERRLSFNDVVLLAFNPIPVGPNVGFTVTYRKGSLLSPKGSLLEGKSVRIKNGMIFDVTPTDRS